MTPVRKARLIALVGSLIARSLCATLRFRLIDRVNVLHEPLPAARLWAFWHNRLLVAPYLFERFFHGHPCAALTSASKDGEIVAAFLERFGIRAIRGSSSRGGGRALVEMKRAIQDGYFMGITPDGPRGPRYRLNPGVVKLAQMTGGTLVPMHVSYSRFWRLKSWDGFMIPKPFATVEIILDVIYTVSPTTDDAAFEAERLRLERFLHPGDEQ